MEPWRRRLGPIRRIAGDDRCSPRSWARCRVRRSVADASRRALVEAVVRAQETAGIEPLTDGGLPGASDPVAAWETTASLTERAVKQALRGPYSLAWSADAGAAQRTSGDPRPRRRGQRHPPGAGRRRLPADRGPRALGDRDRGGRRGARAVPRGPPATPRRRRRDTPLARHHRRQRRRRRDRHDPRPPRTRASPSTSSRVPTTGASSRTRPARSGSCAARCRRPPTATTAPRCCCGRRPTRPRPGLAARTGWASRPRRRWPGCRGPTRSRKIERLGAAARLAEAPASEAVASLDPRAVSSRAAALGYVGPGPSRGPRPDHDPT